MIKRIKSISELPEWFQLKKYDAAKLLNASGWYEQLQIRKRCFYLLEIEHIEEDIHARNNYFKLIRRNPFIDISSRERLSSCTTNKKSISELNINRTNYALGVHPVTPRQFIKIDKSILKERRKHLNSWWNQFDKLSNLEPTKPGPRLRHRYQNWIDEPLHQSSEFDFESNDIISIDLHLPDNLLLEHFKNYLTMRRAEMGKLVKRYRQPDFSEWVRFGILPYLDLKIWEKEENISIPNRVMADALYPTGESGEETVRKTTAPLAESILHGKQLNILAAQAALEISEQNSL